MRFGVLFAVMLHHADAGSALGIYYIFIYLEIVLFLEAHEHSTKQVEFQHESVGLMTIAKPDAM